MDREQYKALIGASNESEWCCQGGAAEDYSLAAAVFQTIDEDVNRTNVGDSVEREGVRRVLRAFALKNPSTGYCQVRNTSAIATKGEVVGSEFRCELCYGTFP